MLPTFQAMMQKAFWDVLTEELEADPPVYKQVSTKVVVYNYTQIQ